MRVKSCPDLLIRLDILAEEVERRSVHAPTFEKFLLEGKVLLAEQLVFPALLDLDVGLPLYHGSV